MAWVEITRDHEKHARALKVGFRIDSDGKRQLSLIVGNELVDRHFPDKRLRIFWGAGEHAGRVRLINAPTDSADTFTLNYTTHNHSKTIVTRRMPDELRGGPNMKARPVVFTPVEGGIEAVLPGDGGDDGEAAEEDDHGDDGEGDGDAPEDGALSNAEVARGPEPPPGRAEEGGVEPVPGAEPESAPSLIGGGTAEPAVVVGDDDHAGGGEDGLDPAPRDAAAAGETGAPVADLSADGGGAVLVPPETSAPATPAPRRLTVDPTPSSLITGALVARPPAPKKPRRRGNPDLRKIGTTPTKAMPPPEYVNGDLTPRQKRMMKSAAAEQRARDAMVEPSARLSDIRIFLQSRGYEVLERKNDREEIVSFAVDGVVLTIAQIVEKARSVYARMTLKPTGRIATLLGAAGPARGRG